MMPIPPPLLQQKILVLERDDWLRDMLVTNLQALGVGLVVPATSVNQALKLLAAESTGHDVIICNLRRDTFDGIDFLRSAARLKPGVLVLTSTLEEDLISSAAAMACGVRLVARLAKPVEMAALKQLLAPDLPGPVPQAPERAPMRAWSAAELRAALRQGQFVPSFQPKVQFSTGIALSAEVLTRWIHPGQGEIAAAQFVPMMEREGLTGELAEDMLSQALAGMQRWRANGSECGIALNVSSHMLQEPALAERWLGIAAEHGVAPQLIMIELAETVSVANSAALLETVGRLRRHGFGLAQDGCGSGYSSLQRISELPFTEIKIDRWFIRQMQENERSLSIFSAIVELGKRLGLHTVAEGIESDSEAKFIHALGCDEGQGDYFAKPMAEAEFAHWLLHGNAGVRNEAEQNLKRSWNRRDVLLAPLPLPVAAPMAAKKMLGYAANPLLDILIEQHFLKNDAALCRLLQVKPALISKIRHGKLRISGDMMIRIHEIFDMPISDMKIIINSD